MNEKKQEMNPLRHAIEYSYRRRHGLDDPDRIREAATDIMTAMGWRDIHLPDVSDISARARIVADDNIACIIAWRFDEFSDEPEDEMQMDADGVFLIEQTLPMPVDLVACIDEVVHWAAVWVADMPDVVACLGDDDDDDRRT